MKTDSILTAMNEITGSADIPVSLIRHAARRATNRSLPQVPATGAAVVPLRYSHTICAV